MAVDISSADAQAIRKLVPLSTLPGPHFEALCAEITIETAERDSVLFKKGDTEADLFYLLSGQVSLQAQGLKVEIIDAESDSARFALAHQLPRKIDAVACNSIRFLRLPTETLSYLSSLSYEEESSYMVIVEPEDNSDDWMTTLLRSPIFQRLPPANLQKIIMSLEEVVFEKGEAVFHQGDPGDYYYLIKSGQCLLTRKPSENAKEIKLALLRTSDTFGEDSLLSDKPRNVTITAISKLSLLRLSRQHFITLIKEPALKYIDFEQTRQEQANGAILLDVRSTEDYNQFHLDDSISAPFFTLRMQLKTLNRARTVVVVCANGKTSEAAAFLLLRNKFKAFILEGGMQKVSPELKKTAALFTIDDGFETTFRNAESSATNPEKEDAPTATHKANPADEGLLEQVEQLKAQNEALSDKNQELIERCKQLEAAKEDAIKQYRILFKQTEKLKEVLDKLKKQ
ncbi:MAG: cyclic nucleotide-binding domain-containing protein [Methylomicrobium sp.]|nr:cyclic nucleotide-binding domain-containing protein [Methylomicrobium sp.]